MSTYQAPLRDMHFLLEELVGIDRIAALPGCGDLAADLVHAVLEEAGKFAGEVLAPLDRVGDVEGCTWRDGAVSTPPGWKAAFEALGAGGWIGLGLPLEYGGQGLPKTLAAPVAEMWASANLAFSLLLPLTSGATEALEAADGALRSRILPRIISGEWAATMALTEPQAGSDLSAVRMRAEPAGDGSYRLRGQKIFITYGEHDLTDNIVHLVLARLPDAPKGVRGISLFVVPKRLIAADGSVGAANDVACVSIEHKLGLHGSPTCVLAFGEGGGAVGHLVGEPNRGLEYMFRMMNEARFSTALQGIAIGERACQLALAYARERVQGRDVLSGEAGRPIIVHPDVKRMVLAMRSQVMAMRALAYTVAGWFDIAERHPEPGVAARHRRLIELLTPVLKAWSTETGNQLAALGVQIHGGMGFIEETGAAQLLRDARITTIYEGTTGIQANDLVTRKILREEGVSARELIVDMHKTAAGLAADTALADLGRALAAAIDELGASIDWLLGAGRERPGEMLAVAVPFLEQMGLVCGAWQLARAALAARRRLRAGADDPGYYEGIVGLARFYSTHQLPQASARAATVRCGGAAVASFAADLL